MEQHLTKDQVKEAIEQAKIECDSHMPSYDSVSLRGILYDLGYSEQQADQVIKACADAGFNYCIDSIIPIPSDKTRPAQSVCYWGPDQLKSRLWSVHL